MDYILQNKLESLPNTPGVYKFLDIEGNILYIGKALSLYNRVNSYFKDDLDQRPRIRQMMPSVHDLEIIETNNEIEALVLESALIKQFQPLYNTDLKDDKSYSWIYISTSDDFPTVKIVRSIKKGEYKRGELFGPYPSGYTVKRVFNYLRKIYPFCNCCSPKDKVPSLYFHLGLCPGPYQGEITKEDYRKNIDGIISFLKGRQNDHIKRLEEEMEEYAKEQNYEKAARLRDRIEDLRYVGEKISFTYYDETETYKSRRVKARNKSFNQLEMELGITNLHKIECYDISNMQGKNAYGSMVVAIDGVLSRSHYRVFKIRSLETPNDPAMLKEVLQRRISNVGKEVDDSLNAKPDIILIDGGRSQLRVIKEYIPEDIILLGISKGKHLKRAGKRKKDEFWIVKDGEVFRLELLSPEILIDLRDEAHRFAIKHYRKRSIKESKKSKLDQIKGIGPIRKKNLIKRFKTVDGIKSAKDEELLELLKSNKILKNLREALTNQNPKA